MVLLFLAAEAIVDPFHNIPLNDDWSYAKPLWILHTDGRIDLGDWPSMSLLTHLLWGLLFVKAFGFSFSVLHLSNLVSAIIGALLLKHIVQKISGNERTAFLAGLCLLLNPLYFNLGNTYMTDVNFNTLLVTGVWFVYKFIETRRLLFFAPVLLVSLALVLLRQYGIILPVAFFAACLFLPERKWLFSALALGLFFVVLLCLRYYETFLQERLAEGAMYKFLEGSDPASGKFWQALVGNTAGRIKKIAGLVLMYSFPFLVIFSRPMARSLGTVRSGLLFTGTVVFVLIVFNLKDLETGNIFFDLSLGPETFYQHVAGTCCLLGHTYDGSWLWKIVILKYGFIIGSLFVLGMTIFLKLKEHKFPRISPFRAFLASAFLFYILLLMITESFFDRYQIPLISLSIIFLCGLSPFTKALHLRALMPLALLAYVSIAGTKDYYTLHLTMQRAYDDLRKEGIEPEKISAGMEINCWNLGAGAWKRFLDLNNFTHVIQYDPEPGFRVYREYEFRRLLPFKKDKINIFVHEQALTEPAGLQRSNEK